MSRAKNDAFTELKGGERLYNLFKKKLEKAPPAHSIARKRRPGNGMNSDNEEEEELCITIPLKGAKGGVSSRFITLWYRLSYFDSICAVLPQTITDHICTNLCQMFVSTAIWYSDCSLPSINLRRVCNAVSGAHAHRAYVEE